MNILEYCDVLNLELEIRYYANQDTRFCANIKNAETKDGRCLVSNHGNGGTPELAVSDYIQQIKGKTLVAGAFSDSRREYLVPESLTGLPGPKF